MFKQKIIIKYFLVFIVVILMQICSYTAIVSDNDGSAFVTKDEFDSLKNNFSKQIHNYNTSIDSKIDGAIAAYLAGMQLTKQEICDSMINKLSSYYWVKDWSPVSTKLGTLGKIYIVAKWHYNNTEDLSTTNVYNDGSISTGTVMETDVTNYSEAVAGTSTSSRDTVQWMWVDSAQGEKTSYSGDSGTNETYTLVYRLNDAFTTPSKDALTILYKNKSWPESQLVLTGGDTNATFNASSGLATIFNDAKPTAGTNETTWGSYAYSMDQKIDGDGNEKTLVGIKGWQQHDEVIANSTWYYALPDKQYTDNSIYTIFVDELGQIGEQRSNWWTVKHGGNKNSWYKVWSYKDTVQLPTTTTMTVKRVGVSAGGEGTVVNNHFGVYLYEHKVNKVGTTDKNYTISNICLDDVSSLVNSFVTYGDGLPLFAASSKGRVKFQLNTGKLTTSSFEIRNSKFGNTDMNTTPFATLSDRNATVTENSASTTTNTLWDIEFDTQNNETYWIMCKPTTTDKIYVKTEGNIINVFD